MAEYDGSTLGIVLLNHHLHACLIRSTPFAFEASIHSIPDRVNLCSSTGGRVLFLDDNSSFYHILNPFLSPGSSPFSYKRIPLQLWDKVGTVFTHHPNTPAVLSIDEVLDDVIYITCPTDGGDGSYGFDRYSSVWGWSSSEERYFLEGPIVAESATSCGSMAYWLVGAPRPRLLMYDPARINLGPYLFDLPDFDLPEGRSRMQLGVVMGDRLGVFLVNSESMALFLWGEGEGEGEHGWEADSYAEADVKIVDDTSGLNGRLVDKGQIVCRELPQAVRFESSGLEVLLLIDGELVSWEEISSDESTVTMALRHIDYDHEDGYDYVGAVPLVYQ